MHNYPKQLKMFTLLSLFLFVACVSAAPTRPQVGNFQIDFFLGCERTHWEEKSSLETCRLNVKSKPSGHTDFEFSDATLLRYISLVFRKPIFEESCFFFDHLSDEHYLHDFFDSQTQTLTHTESKALTFTGSLANLTCSKVVVSKNDKSKLQGCQFSAVLGSKCDTEIAERHMQANLFIKYFPDDQKYDETNRGMHAYSTSGDSTSCHVIPQVESYLTFKVGQDVCPGLPN